MSLAILRRLAARAGMAWLLARAAAGSNCGGTSVGFVPLEALGPGLYNGSPGGLYPAGLSGRPAAHDADLARTGAPVPLDAAGSPDPVNGKIGFISIGMSNATQEFSTFKPIADVYPDKNPKTVIVDCAFPGKVASAILNPSDPYWGYVDGQVSAAGLTNAQVEVVWLKEADANPSNGWPAYAQTLADELGAILQVIKARYPSTRSAYLASRIYGGYASSTLNPEPYAYESGFSVKWLVEEQLAGDPRLNFDSARGPVNAPWIAWGPYFWADGLTPRGDGLFWECADLAGDGTHPDIPGRKKAAAMLLDFFRSDSTTIPWFLACAGSAPVEAQGLRLVKQGVGPELSWASQDASAGAATVYDVMSGALADLPARGGFGGSACLHSDWADTPYVDASGLVLQWKLDEGAGTTAGDSSGRGHDGQASGVTWTAGKLGGGLQFDGAPSVVSVPADADLSPSRQLTVAVWVKPGALTDGVIAGRWISGSQETWMFRIRPDGTLRANFSPTPTDGTYNYAAGTSTPVMEVGAWHHVAMVYDGARATDASRLKIYVDGVAQALAFSPGGIPASLDLGTAPLTAGLGGDGFRGYSGVLDALCVYDRALGEAEVLGLSASGVPGGSVWYKLRARNSCGAGSWGDADLDGHAVYCP